MRNECPITMPHRYEGSHRCYQNPTWDGAFCNVDPMRDPIIAQRADPKCICDIRTCNFITAPVNGDLGDCRAPMPYGTSCRPTCNSGYKVTGLAYCDAGTFLSAKCVPPCTQDCTKEQPYSFTNPRCIMGPLNGGFGDCAAPMEFRQTCTPTCNKGFRLKGLSYCDVDKFVIATCEPL